MSGLRVAVTIAFLVFICRSAAGDPQVNLLNTTCSNYTISENSSFLDKFGETVDGLLSNFSAGNKLFAIVDPPFTSYFPLYALFFCRSYLTHDDCIACLNASVPSLQTCGSATGGRAICDGCTLRYESTRFFDQGTITGNTFICDNSTSSVAGFREAVKMLVEVLSSAVPRIAGFYAAVEKDGVYAYAQCAPTVSEDVCARCLQVAYSNVNGCLPAGNGRAVDAGCFMRYSDAAFFAANQTVDLAQLLKESGNHYSNDNSSTSGVDKGKAGLSRKMRVAVGCVAGGVGVALVLGLLVLLWIAKSRRREEDWKGDILGATEFRSPMMFRYRDLRSATKNFSQENKLGEGGFGDVYKGTLKNGNTVAVKRLAITQTDFAKASFQSEVKLISNVHHRNLVRFLGCCSRRNDLLLVYEYMANGSLDKSLFGKSNEMLSWKQRFDIIVGMARGIACLHHDFHVCIIHRDIKPGNVLLDHNFEPKIADFGLVRLMPGDQSHLTTKFAGTLGYTAPEYAVHGQLTEKVDIYSFGVVLLEIISGRRISEPKLEPVNQYLLKWAWNLYEEDDLVKLIDKSLSPEECDLKELKKVIKIALLCTQSIVAARPNMSEVVVLLLSEGDPQLEPARPVFFDDSNRVPAEASLSAWSSSATQATISVTQISVR